MTATPESKRVALACLVAAFVFLTALVYSDERTGPLDQAALEGRALWHRHGCQVCHQLYGQGGFLGPDLTNAYSRVDSVRLASLLKLGSGQMPAYGLTDVEVAAVTAFLKALDRPDLGWGQLRLGAMSDGNPWQRFGQVLKTMLDADANPSASRGWAVFQGGPCQGCHQPLAAAPTGAPDLSRAAGRLGADELRVVLREGRPTRGMPQPVPSLTETELQDLIAFLEWLGAERSRLEERLSTRAPDRSVDWRSIPWWEYR